MWEIKEKLTAGGDIDIGLVRHGVTAFTSNQRGAACKASWLLGCITAYVTALALNTGIAKFLMKL